MCLSLFLNKATGQGLQGLLVEFLRTPNFSEHLRTGVSSIEIKANFGPAWTKISIA